MLKRVLLLLFTFSMVLPHTIYAADYAFAIGEKHWRVTLSQRALNQLGYKTDRTDGVFTQSTSSALTAFQQKHRLPLTKNIDKQTYDKLMALQKTASPVATKTTKTSSTQSAFNKPSPPITTSINNKVEKKPLKASIHSNDLAEKVVTTAGKYYGVPYKFGGTTHKGFDCSGYTQIVFKQHGITLPRTADMQYRLGRPISKKELRKGDLVFFSTYEPGPSHVGIYDGNGKFWSATTSRGIMASPLNDPYYWGSRYLGARRIF